MGKVVRGRWLAGVAAVLLSLVASLGAQANQPFARVAQERLSALAAPGVNYLLYDVRARDFLAAHWPDADAAVPVGSLVKPFTALAYAQSHGFVFPTHQCPGGDRCWLPRGHGELGITRAVALSCNAYFEELASHSSAEQVDDVARRFGLNGPPPQANAEALTGKFGEWQESPRAMVRAYAMLLEMRHQPGVGEIVDGMAEAARSGTASHLRRAHTHALAKTGTATCVHHPRSTADGFVLVAWPAEMPRYILLVRQHGVPGAEASTLAAQMLRVLEP